MAIVALIIAIPVLVIALTIGINGCISVFFGFCYRIAHVFLWLIDFAQSLMRRLCGLNNDGGDVLLEFLKQPSVYNAFLGILIIALILVVVFTIIQIVRIQWTTEGSKNAVGPLIKTALKSLFFFFLIPTFSMIGIFVSNMFLEAVDEATSTVADEDGQSRSIAGQIFSIASEDANPYAEDNDKIDWVWCGWDDFLNILLNKITFGLAGDYDDDTGIIVRVTGTSNKGEDKVYFEGDQVKGASNLGLTEDAESINLAFSQLTEDAIKFETGFRGQDNYAKRLKKDEPINYTNYDAVYYVYNFSQMNYAVLYIAGYFVLKALIDIVFGLVMRIYKIVILLVISPYPVAASVLDDGQSLNKWKGKFLGELFSSYAVIAGLNLFMMLIPSIIGKNGIQIFTKDAVGAEVGFYNGVLQIIFLTVGCMMIKDIVGIIADLIGANNTMADGEGMSKQVGDMAMKAGSVAMGGLTMASSAAFSLGAGAMALGKTAVNKFQNSKAKKREKEFKDSVDKELGGSVSRNEKNRDTALENAKNLADLEAKEKAGTLTAEEQDEMDKLSQGGTVTSQDYKKAADLASQNLETIYKSDSYKNAQKKHSKLQEKSAGWNKHAQNSAASTAISLRNVHRGAAAFSLGLGNMVGNTSIGKMVDQGTFGLLHKENRSKLDKGIAESASGEAVMKAAAGVEKSRQADGGFWLGKVNRGLAALDKQLHDGKQTALSNLLKPKDRSTGAVSEVDNLLNPFERLVGAMDNNLTEKDITKDFLANFNTSDMEKIAKAVERGIKAGMDPNKMDENTARDLVANRAEIEDKLSYHDPSIREELKEFLDGLEEGLAYKEGSAERKIAFDKASVNAKNLDGKIVTKLDKTAINEIKEGLKNGKTSLKAVMDNKAYNQELRNIISKGFTEAYQRVANAKYDSKQDNLVAELLRQILDVTKSNKK